jgi:FAD:protein FMN transferase
MAAIVREELRSRELEFRAMGGDVHVVVVGGASGLAGEARSRLEDLERRWSRFLDDSEVSRVNQCAGSPVTVSPETALLVRRAVDAWRFTGGAFDPTVLGAVVRAGYDRSFEQLGPAPRGGVSNLRTGLSGVEIDGRTVQLRAGTGFDPGGIGKGLAADLVADDVMSKGADGVCVNVGGDVRVRGVAGDGGPWTIAVEHPWHSQPMALLGLMDGGVATSTTLRRRWTVDGQPRHHLILPRTGQPVSSGLNLATVIAGEAWIAEVLAKAVLIAGTSAPFALLDNTGVESLVVDEGGKVTSTPGLSRFTGG